ncbi:MAG: MFS transporter [Actinomycetaceae bacterium]|nr:MFS transporter [Actinomycetaceae bacterium]MDY6082240.1 MFS transporter [Actinomycetaceae bacterium]
MASLSLTAENRLFKKLMIKILPVAMLGFFFSYLDRVNIGYAQSGMSIDLGFSEAAYGLGAGLFFVGYFIFEIPSNLALVRFGPRKWLARIMVSWGIICSLMFFVTNETVFYIVRFLLGSAEAGFIPGILFYMSQWFPPSRRGRSMSIFYLALALSGTIGGPLSGIILNGMDGVLGHASWEWLFPVEALPTVILGIYIFFYLREDYHDVPWLSAEEVRHLDSMFAREASETVDAPLRKVFSNKLIWLLVFIYFAYNFGLYGISFWLPTLVKDLGVSGALAIGMVSAIPNIAGMILMLIFGYWSDKIGVRKPFIVASFVIGALGFVISISGTSSPVLGLAGLSLADAGALTIPCLFWSFQTNLLSGTALAGGIALINATGNLAGFVAPYVIGVVRNNTGVTTIALYICAAVMLIGAVSTWIVREKEKLVL